MVQTFFSKSSSLIAFGSLQLIYPTYVRVCEERTDLLPPRKQLLLLQLDVYSVHRGAPFKDWLKLNHPYMHIVFVPGGTTSVVHVAILERDSIFLLIDCIGPLILH